MVVVHHSQQSRRIAQQDGSTPHGETHPRIAPGFDPFVPMDQPQGDEEAPQTVLMEGIEGAAAHGEIEGELGEQGEEEQAQGVFF